MTLLTKGLELLTTLPDTPKDQRQNNFRFPGQEEGVIASPSTALLNKHYVQAEAEVERSLALNPGSADLYAWAAGILNWVGRPTEAIGLMEQALHLNPKLPSLYFFVFGQAYYLLGRTAEAIEPLQRVFRVYPHRKR